MIDPNNEGVPVYNIDDIVKIILFITFCIIFSLLLIIKYGKSLY